MLALAVERAEKIALGMQQARATPLHLLLVFVREPRCLAYRCLERLGVVSDRLQQALVDVLRGDAQPLRPARVAPVAAPAQLSLGPMRATPQPRSRRVPPVADRAAAPCRRDRVQARARSRAAPARSPGSRSPRRPQPEPRAVPVVARPFPLRVPRVAAPVPAAPQTARAPFALDANAFRC